MQETLRDVDSVPGSGRFPGGGHGNPLQYFCLENPVDRGAWWVTVHGVSKSWTWLKQLSMQGYRNVVSVLAVYLHDFEADQEHQLAATVQNHQRVSYCISLAWENLKVQNLKYGGYRMSSTFASSRKRYCIQYWHKDRNIDQWNKIESREISPQTYGAISLTKEERIYNEGKTVSSISGIRKTG